MHEYGGPDATARPQTDVCPPTIALRRTQCSCVCVCVCLSKIFACARALILTNSELVCANELPFKWAATACLPHKIPYFLGSAPYTTSCPSLLSLEAWQGLVAFSLLACLHFFANTRFNSLQFCLLLRHCI